MHGRQVFVPIAKMILAELSGGIAERFEQLRDSYIARLQSRRRAGDTDLT
jgi:hypothetical protein